MFVVSVTRGHAAAARACAAEPSFVRVDLVGSFSAADVLVVQPPSRMYACRSAALGRCAALRPHLCSGSFGGSSAEPLCHYPPVTLLLQSSLDARALDAALAMAHGGATAAAVCAGLVAQFDDAALGVAALCELHSALLSLGLDDGSAAESVEGQVIPRYRRAACRLSVRVLQWCNS